MPDAVRRGAQRPNSSTPRRHRQALSTDRQSQAGQRHWHGSKYPSDPDDESEDHELEGFLERLALEADELDEDIASWSGEAEMFAEVKQGLEERLSDLLRRASWNDDRISTN